MFIFQIALLFTVYREAILCKKLANKKLNFFGVPDEDLSYWNYYMKVHKLSKLDKSLMNIKFDYHFAVYAEFFNFLIDLPFIAMFFALSFNPIRLFIVVGSFKLYWDALKYDEIKMPVHLRVLILIQFLWGIIDYIGLISLMIGLIGFWRAPLLCSKLSKVVSCKLDDYNRENKTSHYFKIDLFMIKSIAHVWIILVDLIYIVPLIAIIVTLKNIPTLISKLCKSSKEDVNRHRYVIKKLGIKCIFEITPIFLACVAFVTVLRFFTFLKLYRLSQEEKRQKRLAEEEEIAKYDQKADDHIIAEVAEDMYVDPQYAPPRIEEESTGNLHDMNKPIEYAKLEDIEAQRENNFVKPVENQPLVTDSQFAKMQHDERKEFAKLVDEEEKIEESKANEDFVPQKIIPAFYAPVINNEEYKVLNEDKNLNQPLVPKKKNLDEDLEYDSAFLFCTLECTKLLLLDIINIPFMIVGIAALAGIPWLYKRYKKTASKYPQKDKDNHLVIYNEKLNAKTNFFRFLFRDKKS